LFHQNFSLRTTTRFAPVRFLTLALLGWLFIQPAQALAWWNADWSYRKKVMLNTTPTGVDVKQTLGNAVLLVRLHTGNMAFVDLKEDGGDLRFVSGDDKLPLKHHIESFDPINELAVVWVQLPKLTGGTNAEYVWMYFGNANAAPAEDAKGTYDSTYTTVLHFSGKEPAFAADATANGNNPTVTGVTQVKDGIAGPAARFSGSSRLTIPAAPSLQIAQGGAFTFSAWVRGTGGTLLERHDGGKSLTFALRDGKLSAQVSGSAAVLSTETIPADSWHHIGVTVSDKLTLYMDGREVGSAAMPATALGGEVAIGSSFSGDMDEVQLASATRSADWFHAMAASQGAEPRLISYSEDEQAGSAGHSYFSILLGAVTLDGWVVIGILGIMGVISAIVMVSKTMFVARSEKANRLFIEQFQKVGSNVLALENAGAAGGSAASRWRDSSLHRLYQLGVQELRARFDKHAGDAGLNLKPQAIDAIRSTLDAGIVRENQRLNNQMVLLTIAISGGPFLGLLGTVVGVMITFAAIAAAGDVNVNAIAPGIAAALVATVAGLAVAIPALFGYNYLASKTKNISADMQVFSDEFVTKLAENYSG
jgi:biopolymer transport protein ExbB